jgi:hypothetical protein
VVVELPKEKGTEGTFISFVATAGMLKPIAGAEAGAGKLPENSDRPGTGLAGTSRVAGAFGGTPNPPPPKGFESIAVEGTVETVEGFTTGVLGIGPPLPKVKPPDPETFGSCPNIEAPDDDGAITGGASAPLSNEKSDTPILPIGGGGTEALVTGGTVEPKEKAGVGAAPMTGKLVTGADAEDKENPTEGVWTLRAGVAGVKSISQDRHFKDPLGFCT